MTVAGFVPKLGIPDQPKLSQCAAVLVHGLELAGETRNEKPLLFGRNVVF